MDYRRIIFEGIEIGYDYRIDLAGMYVIKFNNKFTPIHNAHSRRPYIINNENNNKMYLIGKYINALYKAIEYIGI